MLEPHQSEPMEDFPLTIPLMASTDSSLWDALRTYSPGVFHAMVDVTGQTWTLQRVTTSYPSVQVEESIELSVHDSHQAWIFNTWALTTWKPEGVFSCELIDACTLRFTIMPLPL